MNPLSPGDDLSPDLAERFHQQFAQMALAPFELPAKIAANPADFPGLHSILTTIRDTAEEIVHHLRNAPTQGVTDALQALRRVRAHAFAAWFDIDETRDETIRRSLQADAAQSPDSGTIYVREAPAHPDPQA
jgi:hypothetical protein